MCFWESACLDFINFVQLWSLCNVLYTATCKSHSRELNVAWKIYMPWRVILFATKHCSCLYIQGSIVTGYAGRSGQPPPTSSYQPSSTQVWVIHCIDLFASIKYCVIGYYTCWYVLLMTLSMITLWLWACVHLACYLVIFNVNWIVLVI